MEATLSSFTSQYAVVAMSRATVLPNFVRMVRLFAGISRRALYEVHALFHNATSFSDAPSC